MDNLEQILTKYNWPQRTESALTTIEEIEDFIKSKLPHDYVSFLRKYMGSEGFIGQEYVVLWNIDELIEFNKTYCIPDNLPQTLGIGGNGASEFIAIELLNNKYRIVLSPFIDLDEQYHIEIGTSFSDFLLRLDNGKNWFNEILQTK